uniref:Scaffolding anchor of CK1 domain-containing protein n=1 Tax=Melopsittacus undulatus TaxID=13146 RepID=A0A8C6JL76_MELUD
WERSTHQSTRLEQLKKPWWREPTPLVLQHSETARLAIDAFLEQGERGYLNAITEERELPFLSTLDMEYMSHQRNQSFPDPSALKDKGADPGDADTGDRFSLNSELTSGTYFPLMSDVHPPELELGWPGMPFLTVSGQTQATVVFQRNKANSIKDLLRSLISRARTVYSVTKYLVCRSQEILAALLHSASGTELLEHFSLVQYMCLDQLFPLSFQNMRIRCLSGDVYYSKAGKKFAGQVLEKFILIDCDQVLAGTYSFTWLCSQVHTGLVTHFRGQIVAEFEKEFRYLYAESRTHPGINLGKTFKFIQSNRSPALPRPPLTHGPEGIVPQLHLNLPLCSLRPFPLVPSLVPWEQSPAPPGSILLSGSCREGISAEAFGCHLHVGDRAASGCLGTGHAGTGTLCTRGWYLDTAVSAHRGWWPTAVSQNPQVQPPAKAGPLRAGHTE